MLAAILGNPFSLGTVAYSAFAGETNEVQVDPNLFLTIADAPSVSQIPVPPCVHSEFLESISVSFGVSFIVSFDLGFSLLPFDLPEGVLCPSYLAGSSAMFGQLLADSVASNSASGGSAIAGAALAQGGGYFLQVEPDTGTVDDYDLYHAVVDPAAAIAESEPNDGAPDGITAGTLITGSAAEGDIDTFSFVANAGDEIVIIANNDPEGDGSTINPRLTLSGPALSEEVQGLGGATVLGAVTAAMSGSHTLSLENTGFTTGDDADDYSFVVIINPAEGNESEPNHNSSSADLLASGEFAHGSLPSGDADFYEVQTGAAGHQVFSFVDTQNAGADTNDTFLTLLESDGTTVIASDDDGGATVTPGDFDNLLDQLGDANVDVDGLTSVFNGSLEFTLLDQDDIADLSRVDYNPFAPLQSAIIIDGGTGNDTLLAGGGINLLTGDTGNDTFVFNKNYDSQVTLEEDAGAGEGEDTILVEGTPGNDIIRVTRSGNDLIVEYSRLDTPNGPSTLYARSIYGGLLSGNNVERFVFQGDEGDDLLIVDSSNGPIRFQGGINFVAGDGTDRLELTGGTATENQFLVGPDGSGTSLITIGGVTQIVNYEGMDPIVQSVEDTVAGPIEIFTTQYADIINITAGPQPDLTRFTSNNESTIDFANKTALTVRAGEGGNDIAVQVGAEQGFAPGMDGSRSITLFGEDGDDAITIAPGLPPLIAAVLDGGSGDDVLIGGDHTNTLIGGSGNDELYGSDSGDLLNGGSGDDLLDGGLSLNSSSNTYLGGEGIDTIVVAGTELDDNITATQTTNTTVTWSIDGSDDRLDTFQQVERIVVETYGGDDLVTISMAETLTLATRYVVDGGANDGADVLALVDQDAGDLILHRQGPNDQGGTLYPDALGPIVYRQIENVEVTPANPVTGGTGDDGAGRVVVLDQDPFEFNDTIFNATDIESLAGAPHNLAIDVGGDEDWYHFRAPKIGTFSFEILFARVATLPGSGELQAAVYREDGTLIAASSNTLDGDVVSFSADRLEDYYLRVEGVNATVLNAYDVNLAEVDLVGPQVYDPDGPGPAQPIQIGGDPDFDLFDPKGGDNAADPQGPTPPVNSILINVRDILNRADELPADLFNRPVPNGRAPGDLYPALDAEVAAQIGHYELRGDNTGVVAIEQVIVTNAPPVAGAIATATVELVFFRPLPDDRYTLTIFDSLIDPPGNAFDGNSNAAQPLEDPTFPSGDFNAGGDFVGRFTVDTAAEVGVWAAGSVYVDTNGNETHDPSTGDPTHRDITYTFGFTTDTIFAGNFYDDRINVGAAADGFDKIAAYGRVDNRFRWLVDTDNDGVADLLIEEPMNQNGLPVAGNFDGDAANGDEVGLLSPTAWLLDTDHDFQLDTILPTNMVGYPIVGDFDGDGIDDLGAWTQDYFALNLSTLGAIDGRSDTLTSNDSAAAADRFRFGFPGPRDRPVAADMDGDGIDDVGLWVPDRSGAAPLEGAEWYFLISDERSITDRIVDFDDFEGDLTIDFTPVPFGVDRFIQFGDEFAQPVVGNFDPPLTSETSSVDPAVVDLYDGRFHNTANPEDVDASGMVSLHDGLIVVSDLRTHGVRTLYNVGTGPFVDVNDDATVSLSDAIAVVFRLRQEAMGGGEGEAIELPEDDADAQRPVGKTKAAPLPMETVQPVDRALDALLSEMNQPMSPTRYSGGQGARADKLEEVIDALVEAWQ